ncbi:nucleotidyl transferase AbiEii/AbiGii toxin family protein [Sulfuricurvum sp.]|uniref:nucleotidyl transferase AbiEii/AbiGii toxin family protein n=1 Tax=Sulfuricurvum sp. TaxID=2025608 RepID=UPI003C63FE8E
MHDFVIQQRLLHAALALLDEKNITAFAFGGGTALSAFYWRHRYSTDIDIFLYPDGSTDRLDRLRRDWSDNIESIFSSLGYSGVMRAPGHYLELTIDDQSKIQFFDVKPYTQTPYRMEHFWGHILNIETPAEIIAKKIHYRGSKGHPRDIFDIAVAVHHNPTLFSDLTSLGRINEDDLNILYATLSDICSDEERIQAYHRDISAMTPNPEYRVLSIGAPEYLLDFVGTLLSLRETKLDNDELIIAEKCCYEDMVEKFSEY